MAKHTQRIRWQQPKNCLSVFDHFVNLALKGLTLALTLYACHPQKDRNIFQRDKSIRDNYCTPIIKTTKIIQFQNQVSDVSK